MMYRITLLAVDKLCVNWLGLVDIPIV